MDVYSLYIVNIQFNKLYQQQNIQIIYAAISTYQLCYEINKAPSRASSFFLQQDHSYNNVCFFSFFSFLIASQVQIVLQNRCLHCSWKSISLGDTDHQKSDRLFLSLKMSNCQWNPGIWIFSYYTGICDSHQNLRTIDKDLKVPLVQKVAYFSIEYDQDPRTIHVIGIPGRYQASVAVPSTAGQLNNCPVWSLLRAS